jgi:hypothetical protein
MAGSGGLGHNPDSPSGIGLCPAPDNPVLLLLPSYGTAGPDNRLLLFRREQIGVHATVRCGWHRLTDTFWRWSLQAVVASE